jgi:hypothetical protein
MAAAIALGGVACSNSTTAPPVDLSGTYQLVSIQFGTGQPTLTPPAETGSFTLTATTYTLTLSGAVSQTDAGTYTLSGSNWSQSSTQNGFQSTGTYTLSGATLTVTTVQQGVTVVSVWQKQP